MINANELRLGNWITVSGSIGTVTAIVDNYLQADDGTWLGLLSIGDKKGLDKSIFGIPLTEEWLLKFGFEKEISETGPPINDELTAFSLNGYEFSEDTSGNWYLCGYNWNTKHFKYVHQLQNIYFALTGEELEITQIDPTWKRMS